MNILFVSSEVVPFSKTGGLADVCGTLPIELAKLGHDAAVITPAHRNALTCGQTIEPTGIDFDIPIGSKIVRGSILRSHLPNSDVSVYLIHAPEYFDRPELYREKGEDYKDNCERFVFFCRAVMEAIRLLDLHVDVLHCSDWQSSLVPAYLQIEYRHARNFDQIGTVLTIHNMAYQGQFWHWDMALTGLDWKYFNWHQLEFYGNLNLLKTGLVFSDALTTVSPRYAQEIQSDPLGCGLEGVLQQRHEVLTGIVNGVDYATWNPATDPHLAAKYSAANWRTGKAACKAALQKEFNLPVAAGAPVVGLIGRLADQKGWDLVTDVMKRWAPSSDVQWVILGTGEPHYQKLLTQLAQEFPAKVAVRLEFCDAAAHRIEAGSDMFLMPSRYEPCGLNQLFSLKYGTVPVVRATGGLADTITDATPENLAAKTANGFSFVSYDIGELETTLHRACDTFRNQPDVWRQLVETGMKQDWSWANSARQYIELYNRTLARKRQNVCVAT